MFSLHMQTVAYIIASRLQVDRKCTHICAHAHTYTHTHTPAVTQVQNLTEIKVKAELGRHSLLCMAFSCPEIPSRAHSCP